MKKSLVYSVFVGVTAFTIGFSAPSYGWRMTGSGGRDNRTQEQRQNWSNQSRQNNKRLLDLGRKGLNKLLGPYGTLIDKTEKFSERYNRYQQRKGNVGKGTGVIRNKDWK